MRPVVEAHRTVPADEIRALASYTATLYGSTGSRTGPVDREIPAEHYRAVAEVIGFVLRLRRRAA